MKAHTHFQFLFVKIVFLLLIFGACKNSTTSLNPTIEEIEEAVVAKLEKATEIYGQTTQNPRTINQDGSTHFVASGDWTSGFFPGCLWYGYELSNNDALKVAANHFTLNIEDQKVNGKTHDMGFKIYCSFGNGYRLNPSPQYKEVLLTSAKTLITRYSPVVGCIRSWDHNQDKWDFPVIIDNMMNLELLMWAFKQTNDSTYYNIAVSHANTTLKNHFREDNSCYHVIGYDPITGEVVKKNTHQGFSHSSAWSRGQAWAIYGYTMMYRETGIEEYLTQAQKISEYIFNHPNLPEDLVPYWDFNAPNIPNEPRDASAAAIICSALYELSKIPTENSQQYKANADKIFASLCNDPYFAKEDAKHHFLLEHSTGSFPHDSEIDVPIIYGDYYFVEALKRKKNLDKNIE